MLKMSIQAASSLLPPCFACMQLFGLDGSAGKKCACQGDLGKDLVVWPQKGWTGFCCGSALSEKDTEGCPHVQMYLQTPMWVVHSLLLLQTAAGKEFLKPGGCLCQSLQLLRAHFGARANNRLKLLIVISAMGLQVHLWSQLVYVMKSDWLNS